MGVPPSNPPVVLNCICLFIILDKVYIGGSTANETVAELTFWQMLQNLGLALLLGS